MLPEVKGIKSKENVDGTPTVFEGKKRLSKDLAIQSH